MVELKPKILPASVYSESSSCQMWKTSPLLLKETITPLSSSMTPVAVNVCEFADLAPFNRPFYPCPPS